MSVGVKFARDMFIFLNVTAYIRFKLLPPSMNTRDTSILRSPLTESKPIALVEELGVGDPLW